MILGVTGTRYGITDEQGNVILSLAREAAANDPILALHYGDCVGADEQVFKTLFYERLCPEFHCRPASDVALKWRAKTSENSDYKDAKIIVYPSHRAMLRNREIVSTSDRLWAFPRENEEQKYGGTWRTVTMARHQKVPTFIVYPDGRVQTTQY